MAPPEAPREPTAKQLFDAAWYTSRHPEVPQDHEEAYKSYLDSGMRAGHAPNALFESLRFPSHTTIPHEHLYRVTASPVLSRVPPTRYLELYRPKAKRRVHHLYGTLDEYLRRALTAPDLINAELWENDLRVTSYMDGIKNRLAAEYFGRPQDTLVSVILTTRNRASRIADAIVSVLIQSYKRWELIVVDDGSDDNSTEAVVRQFDDTRIKYVRMDEQGGIGRACNLGIERSSGRAIAYLSDDTQWDPDCLLISINQMQSHGARVSYSAHAVWDGFDPDARLGQTFKTIRFAPFNRSLLENTNYVSVAALVHDRALLDEVGWFDCSLERGTEWDLVLRLTDATRPLAVPCLLSHHFQDRTSDSAVQTGEEHSSSDLRAKLTARSDWSQRFTTESGTQHQAFSTSRQARERRRRKLARLPAERVQILIPNYEAVHELDMCLRSIAEHTHSPYEILVIDNGSSEESYAELATLCSSFENVRLIQENSSSGFTFAVNRGLADIADCNDKILILNNDTLVTPDWLNEMRYVLSKHPDAGMAVPRQVVPGGNKAAKIHVPGAINPFECDINLSAQHLNIVDPSFDLDDDLVELSYAPLFCSLIRPEVFRNLGALDSGNGPHYRSDWILCDSMRRLLRQRIIYTPHSKVYHLLGVATRAKKTLTQPLSGSPSAEASPEDNRGIGELLPDSAPPLHSPQGAPQRLPSPENNALTGLRAEMVHPTQERLT
ncbi:glycosyltransferase family 2 protein [Microvirga roseola]|uniref:glycosyltransferase family 2 protein n=1 Tax=Microvirga roseola TaxID=2883126 RepID=UPI001E2B8DFF|nr:glycosyltransferase [Microvirga roseola]